MNVLMRSAESARTGLSKVERRIHDQPLGRLAHSHHVRTRRHDRHTQCQYQWMYVALQEHDRGINLDRACRIFITSS
jgi:hypothetical protein